MNFFTKYIYRSSYRFYIFILFATAIIIPVILFSFIFFAKSIKKPTSQKVLNTRKLSDYSAVKKSSSVIFVSLHTDTGYLYKSSTSGVDAAKELIKKNPDFQNRGAIFPSVNSFEVKDIVKDVNSLFLKKKNIALSNEHIVFSQLVKGVPIFSSQLTIHIKNGNEIYDISGSWVTDTSIEPEKFSEDFAKQKALVVAKKSYSKKPLVVVDASKVIVNLRLLGTSEDERNYPAVRVLVENKGIPREFATEYFVSLTTGDIIFTQDKIESALERKIYDCEGNSECTDDHLIRSEGEGDSSNRDGDSAYAILGEVYSYYKNKYGRDSIDNQGKTLEAFVNYGGDDCPNAAWDGREMIFCSGLVARDITAHELTHGVVQFTVDLVGKYQPLSINESIADIFGSGIDNNWTIGEGSAVGIVRNMQDPPSHSGPLGPQPDRLFSKNYYCGSRDSGGGHVNNGVLNKSYYLMVEGGSFNGCSFEGIGREKAEAIMYQMLVARYISPQANFFDVYSGILKACSDLYQADSSECTNVKQAIQSTELDQQPQGSVYGPVCSGIAHKTPTCRIGGAGNSDETPEEQVSTASAQITPTQKPIPTISLAPPLAGLSITTDKTMYTVNDKINICYKIPGSDYVELRNILPDNPPPVIAEGVDDGPSRCFDGIVNPPIGEQCVRIIYGHSKLYSSQACFTVKESSSASESGKLGISPLINPFDLTQDSQTYYECHNVTKTKTESGKQIQVQTLECQVSQ